MTAPQRYRGGIAVILNEHAGHQQAGDVTAILREVLGASGRPVEIVVTRDRAELDRAVAVAIAARPSAIVAGGGDGTLNQVVQQLLPHDIPFGILPLGTLNHFAKDLGLPLGVAEAAAVIAAGRIRKVDVGEVGGRVFLNNSSVGLYPRILRLRQEHPAHGVAKWAVAAWAALKTLTDHPAYQLAIEINGETLSRRTPLLFVGNNEYHMTGLDPGSRDTLSGGSLAFYVVNTTGAWRLCRLMWRVIMGRAIDSGALELLVSQGATISTPDSSLHVAVDGEVESLPSPLEYRIRPEALSVFVP